MQTVRRTVGFADLTSWTRAAEALGDAGAVALLEDAYRHAGDAITKHGGTIHKYIGDAIMFWFDAPAAAVAAAREIVGFRRTIANFDVHFSAAVATGDVVLVQLGHPSKRMDDIIGTTVNRAGKLLGEAHRSPERWAACDVTRGAIG